MVFDGGGCCEPLPPAEGVEEGIDVDVVGYCGGGRSVGVFSAITATPIRVTAPKTTAGTPNFWRRGATQGR